MGCLTKMKGPLLLLAGCLLASVAQASDPKSQQDINALLWKIYEPLRASKMGNAPDDAFSPVADLSMYSDGGEAAKNIEADIKDGRVLKQKNYFSLFNPRHREEALMIFETLMACKDWSPCFSNNAAYFRTNMNEGVFLYGFYVAIIHHPIADGLVLPPLYDVTPHLFTNSEVINQAYTSKMTATPGKFNMGYTGSQKNPEQRVAYFGEDIGMNVHHVSWHMDFPFWWKDNYGYNLDRKGELFFWAHHQLTARFDAERLSNNLDVVDELYWDRPIHEGFAPHTSYKYGGEFPARPDDIAFNDVDGVARIRDLMIWEDRIRDAIAHGYVTGHNGEIINILDDHGIDVLGDIIESSEYSPNSYYYGALHNTAHIVLGRQGDPHGKFKQPPGVMEHFETATRDPAFFRLHKYMDNIFTEFKERLPAYTYDELNFEGVDVESFSIDGSLETFFEDFEFSLLNAVDDTVDVADAKASVRIYMCPRYDNNGVAFGTNEGRHHCFELDKFWTKLAPGANTVIHKSSESSVTVPDSVSFATLIEKADEAVAAGKQASGMEDYSRNCGIPDRLLLPKGNERGLEFSVLAFVNDGSNDHTETFDLDGHYGGTHAQCGIHGQKYPDLRPMGFPLDRHIDDTGMFGKVSNIKQIYTKVYHKN